MGQRDDRLRILYKTIVVRTLDIDTRGVRCEIFFQRCEIRRPVFRRDFYERDAPALAVRLHDSEHLGMDLPADQHLRPFPLLTHEDRLCGRRRPIIDRGIRDIHAGQFTDHRLVLEDGLQDPLADFRLIRRIRRAKGFLGNHLRDDRGDVVVIRPCATENRIIDSIFRRHFLQVLQDFHLTLTLGHRQLFQIDLLRDCLIECIDRRSSDRCQLRYRLFERAGYIASHTYSSTQVLQNAS